MNQHQANCYCGPGEKLSEEIKNQLLEANLRYSKSKNFTSYRREIEQIFQINTPTKIPREHLFFLGGFIEAEGSLNVSAKKLSTAKFGILIDPEFSITQHVNGIIHLYNAMYFFQTGRIRHKSGSNATLVFTIDNRQSLKEKVIPFLEKYTFRYSSAQKTKRCISVKNLLELFNQDGHKDLNVLKDEILPLWHSLRMQQGQINQTFNSLEDAQNYVQAFFIEQKTEQKTKNQGFGPL